MGLIYEVNISVSEEVAPRYREWLKGHVERMLELPAFSNARISQVLEPKPRPGTTCFSIHYETESLAALESYFASDAPRMRAEAERDFSGQFSAERRWMEVIK